MAAAFDPRVLFFAPEGWMVWAGTTYPTAATDAPDSNRGFVVGDTIINSAPTSVAALMWRCTTAGSPGTWTPYQPTFSVSGGADNITAHAGGGQASATPLTGAVNRIATVATAADSVKLPASVAGMVVYASNDAANAAQVFGAGTDTIDDVATATGVPLPGKSSAVFSCPVAGKWYRAQVTLLNNAALMSADSTGALTVSLIKSDASNCVRIATASPAFTRIDGMTKLFNRPLTLDAFAVQVKSEVGATSAAAHACIEVTVDWTVSPSSGYVRAVQGVARLAAAQTMTGGAIEGLYGQFCNLGIINGAGVMCNAIYGLIEDGGTYTAIDHLAAAWLDSHLTKTITAGVVDFLYISNNGSTTFNDVFYIYGGNKISDLFAFDTCGTMIVKTPGTYSTADGYIAISVDGSPMRIAYFAGTD